MPKLNDASMEEYKNIGTFGFSATKIDKLGSTEYTLVNILVDASGSVSGFGSEMEAAIKETIKACQLDPRADSLMVRVCKFHDSFEEVHGFKLLEKINLDDYNNVMHCGGSTLLFDSVINAMDATVNYAKSLFHSDFKCNGITVVITDGGDTHSKFGKDDVAQSLTSAVTSEYLESLVSILVGVNVTSSAVQNFLSDFNKEAKFSQYVELGNASSSTLAKLANFVSKSISQQSLALGTGGPSKSLTF